MRNLYRDSQKLLVSNMLYSFDREHPRTTLRALAEREYPKEGVQYLGQREGIGVAKYQRRKYQRPIKFSKTDILPFLNFFSKSFNCKISTCQQFQMYLLLVVYKKQKIFV